MHQDYIEKIRRVAKKKATRECEDTSKTHTPITLKQICLNATSKHMDVIGMNVLDLPTALIKDLLPNLNIVDLDYVHPTVKLKGISTSCLWSGILQNILGTSKKKLKLKEDELRQKAMERLFYFTFFGYRFRSDIKYLLNVNFNSMLLVMAKHVHRLCLHDSRYLYSFISEQRPVLSVLEKSVRCIEVERDTQLISVAARCVLYVLHRLIDHGAAGEVVMWNPDPILLGWILHGRQSQGASQSCPVKNKAKGTPLAGNAHAANSSSTIKWKESIEDDEEEHVIPCKRPRLTSLSLKKESEEFREYMAPEHLCQIFTPSAGPTRQVCPLGQIHSLEIKEFGDHILPVLLPLLSTWLCLRSLILSSRKVFQKRDVLILAESLKELSETSGSSLTELSVGYLADSSLVGVLLDACHNLRSFSMEIHPMEMFHRPLQEQPPQQETRAELLLEKMTVKLPQVETNLESLYSVLKRSSNLAAIHISGVRLSRGHTHDKLLQTITESNRCLKKLHLEDMNLADCHCAIFNLLGNCMLEELSFKDCRLLEKCSKKDEFMRELVTSLKAIASLRSLNLSHNRLAKNVPALGELFTGTLPSTLTELDISSNFIQPPELLELAKELEKRRPPQHFTLDLMCNPLDRDPLLRDQALDTLRPLCHVLTDQWNSRTTMADHISNM
ncbi:leucine-rich repeat-containing protein 41 [Osmerus mordax]|uniref:leucine-rich repeat-containing protein 41 n=1 Tax=Osmerus mordax TaxID=8014 RepID=UPI00350F3C32